MLGTETESNFFFFQYSDISGTFYLNTFCSQNTCIY